MKRRVWMAGFAALGLAGVALAQGDTGKAGAATSGSSSADGGTPGTQFGTQPKDTMGVKTPQQGTNGTNDNTAGSSFAANRLTGRIQHVDKAQHQVTIAQAGKAQNLKFGDNSTIFYEGRLGSIDDLKEGQEVRAAYEERDGQKNLRWLDVTSKEPGGTAATGTPQAGGAASNDQALQSVSGTIRSVDPKANQITIGEGSQQRTLEVKKNSQILLNGEKLSINQLKEGDQVRASLDPTQKTATRIEVLSGPTQGSQSNQPQQNDTTKKPVPY